MADYYCVGPAMAADWEAEHVCVTRRLVLRSFGYFLPYWRRGLLALGCIAAGAALGLVPALIAKKLIDHLSSPGPRFSHVLGLVGFALAAALVAGLIGGGRVVPVEHDQPGDHVRPAPAAVRPAARPVGRLLHAQPHG
jgi:hypothetical protein